MDIPKRTDLDDDIDMEDADGVVTTDSGVIDLGPIENSEPAFGDEPPAAQRPAQPKRGGRGRAIKLAKKRATKKGVARTAAKTTAARKKAGKNTGKKKAGKSQASKRRKAVRKSKKAKKTAKRRASKKR
jgi:hypothetical protein